MSDKAMKDLLEKAANRVLYEMAKELLYSAKGANIDAAKAQLELDRKVVADVLKHPLLPLLEAGQECAIYLRDALAEYKEAHQGDRPFVTGIESSLKRYATAFQAAKGS